MPLTCFFNAVVLFFSLCGCGVLKFYTILVALEVFAFFV